ncbi:xanthine dehydrogenase family protein molybdopterin-binding subunit [Deferrisoma palaeochoriense]
MEARRFRHVGRATPRKDGRDIVTGRAEYIDDLSIPGLLHGAVLRSPHPHAEIVAVDSREALSMPGVRAVLTHENVPPWRFGIPRVVPVLDRKVRYVGDAVALVAAETREQARAALDRIRVTYRELPAVYTLHEATAPGAPALYNQFPGNLLPVESTAFGPHTLSRVVLGDVEAGFAAADVIHEGEFGYETVPNPLPIEPPGVIVRWDGPDALTVWAASQSAQWYRFMMTGKMGFPDIHAIGTQCGGSFGSKNYAPLPFFYAAALARATGRPVKVMYTKEEQFGAFVLRLGSRFRGRIGLRRDGTVTAVEGEWLVDTGAYSDQAQTQIAVGCGEAQLVLRCPNWNLQPRLVVTNRAPSGIVRGFGGQELESSLLPVVMGAVEAIGMDPVEFFKKNYVKPGDGYLWREGGWWVCRGHDYSTAIEKGAERFGWAEQWKGWLVPTEVRGDVRVGVGVGVHGNADVGEDESEAYVRLEPDGRAVIHAGVCESGMGQRSSLCKMVADVLDLPLERVTLTPPDSRVNPFDFGLTGSRGTWAVGAAVVAAAEDARRQLLERASPVLGARPETLDTRDGLVFVRGEEGAAVPWRKVFGVFASITGHGAFRPDYSMPNFLILFVRVAVDTGTGRVDLERVVAATDVGQIIDPPTLEGQIFGALGAAGLDTALFEETLIDRRLGRMLNPNLIDYKWRTFEELPRFEAVVLETPLPSHRFGAIGVGEISTSPGPAAVLMAASNALGVRLDRYPLTPDRVLAAWERARKGGNG